ncbi:MAG TPA: ATP-binding protein [Oligoflexus sp.]|uniref:ATP-binding protein n=1 Tax=Oligoflexus sp. TaxID=1971216 RepID=UPI002D471C9D|nr:ATP-binding protein [Oligoflexus sp.]HYX31546.1 ATP-binding protein [Oligoflexus sp.]
MPYVLCPHNEPQRLMELQRLRAMENVVDKSYSNYTLMASTICRMPAAAISLIDSDRQWFRATIGLHLTSTPRKISFCTHAIMQQNVFIVQNAHLDPMFQDNPLVLGEPKVCFYAGAPLLSSRGHNLGTLCVMDFEERTLSPEQVLVLKQLASQIVIQLEESMAATALSITLTRLQTFLDHMDFAALIEDEDGNVLYANEAFTRMFPSVLDLTLDRGSEKKPSLIDAIQSAFMHPESFLDLAESLMINRRKHLAHELRMVGGDTLEIDYIPTVDNQHYHGHIWIFRDVTEQRRSAAQMEQHKMQIVQAEKLAILGEMAAGLAHEINNPLAIIQGQAHCLRLHVRRNVIDAEVVEKTVQSIEKTTVRITKIIQGLRAFAREDGQTELQKVLVQTLIDDALMFCESRIRNHGYHLRVSPFPQDLSIWCRPVQITQVLVHLLNNAFDACRMHPTPDQWIEIQVLADQDAVTLRVADSGPGIPRELSEKIMLPFFTTKEIGKGSGLGLSIAKGIVESHSGRFFLDPEALHTTFVMKFPADRTPLPFDRPHY